MSDPSRLAGLGPGDFDYVLVSDPGRELPEGVELVLLLVPLTMGVVAEAVEEIRRLAGADHRVLAVPSRVDPSRQLDAAQVRFALREALTDVGSEVLSPDEIPYDPAFYYNDTLAVSASGPSQQNGLAPAYERLGRQILDIGPRSVSEAVVVSAPRYEPWAEWIADRLRLNGVGVRETSLADFTTEQVRRMRADQVGIMVAAVGLSNAVQAEFSPDDPTSARLFAVDLEGHSPPVGSVIDLSARQDENSAETELLSSLRLIARTRSSSADGARFPAAPPRSNLPATVERFVGRETQLAMLRRRHLERAARPLVLYGPAGIGKTALAAEYARRFSRAYDYVWWIDAATPTTVHQGLTDFARALGVPVTDNDDWRGVADHLAERRCRSLLVFDDADAVAGREATELLLGVMGNTHVLLTRRDDDADEAGVLLQPMGRDESAELFTQGTGLKPRRDDELSPAPDQVIAHLDGLPLAVVLARAWLLAQLRGREAAERKSQSPQPTRQILQRFAADFERLRAVSPGQEPHEVVLRMALNTLVSDEARWLLSISAWLSTDGVSIRLLRWLLANRADDPHFDRLQADRHLSQLRDSGLVTLNRSGEAGGELKLHRSIREYLREQRNVDVEQVRGLLGRYAPLEWDDSGPEKEERATRFEEVGRHFRDVDILASTSFRVRSAVVQYLRHCYTSEQRLRWEAGRKLGEEALRRWAETDAHVQLRHQLEMHLANVIRSLGDYERAREMSASAFKALVKSPGLGHPVTLHAAMTRAADYRMNSEFRNAYYWDFQARKGFVGLLGADHPMSALALHNLAGSASFMGRPHEARRLGRELLDQLTRIRGKHPDMLTPMCAVSHYLRVLDHNEEASELLSDALAIVSRWPAVSPLQKSRVLNDVAVTERRLGDAYAGLIRDKATLEDLRNGYGEESVDFLRCALSYVAGLHAEGESFNAVMQAERYLGIARRTIPENSVVSAFQSNLGAYLDAVERHDDALVLAREGYQGFRRRLGAGHPYTLAAEINYLAVLHRTEPKEAIRRSVELHRRLHNLFGPGHAHTRIATDNLAVFRAIQTGGTGTPVYADVETQVF
ncbi:FxSxx-COOH system tetratricopeptide repeat protein [Nonomuraea sp. NPDC050790]|uniref:FxSxx-COOH system tetratricopeptide repeat protein n=1 Tax=Nonomuraea sp. NPDC050790 TaxID=3364371 RepID=UPI003798B370